MNTPITLIRIDLVSTIDRQYKNDVFVAKGQKFHILKFNNFAISREHMERLKKKWKRKYSVECYATFGSNE